MSGPLQLEVSDLRVEIAGDQGVVRPIDGVSLEIAAGEAVGLVGESGSGKSMTLKSILGLLPPDATVTSGSVVFDGTDLTIAFNPSYLIDGVEAVAGDEVLLETVDATKPATVRAAEQTDFRYLLMPVRVS